MSKDEALIYLENIVALKRMEKMLAVSKDDDISVSITDCVIIHGLRKLAKIAELEIVEDRECETDNGDFRSYYVEARYKDLKLCDIEKEY